PLARGDQVQSARTGPDRSRTRYRGLYPAGAFGATIQHPSHAAIAPCAEQQEYSGRPDRDGDAARLGGYATTIARTANGHLMPRARSEQHDNLLLIAATDILILTADQLFRDGSRSRLE